MIYCVEDDAGIRNMMVYALNAGGYHAAGFPDGAALFQALAKERPELVILDIMLPGEDGISILRRLRSQRETASLPIIMATAKTTEYDRVVGLDCGADDYLCKPFGMLEMVSRVKAVLRRAAPAPAASVLHTGELELNTAEHTVCVQGQPVQLTLKEYELLKLFMAHPGQVFTREQLLDAVWTSDYLGETRTIDVHIGTLRTKLGPCGNYIATVRGVGYRMEKQR